MRRLMLLALAIAMPGCGGNKTTTAPTIVAPPPTTLPPRSAITVSFDPDPVIAVATGESDFPWRATYTLIIRETAGLPCNLNRWDETLMNPVTNLQAPTRTYTVADAQRGENAQPGGTAVGAGTVPLISVRRSTTAPPACRDSRGIERIRPRV